MSSTCEPSAAYHPCARGAHREDRLAESRAVAHACTREREVTRAWGHDEFSAIALVVVVFASELFLDDRELGTDLVQLV